MEQSLNESIIWWTVYDFRSYLIKLLSINFLVDIINNSIRYKNEKGLKLSIIPMIIDGRRRDRLGFLTVPTLESRYKKVIFNEFILNLISDSFYISSIFWIKWFSLILILLSLSDVYLFSKILIKNLRKLIKSKHWIWSINVFVVKVILQIISIAFKVLIGLSMIIYFSLVWSHVFNSKNFFLIIWPFIRPLLILLFSILTLIAVYFHIKWFYKHSTEHPLQ